LERRSFGSESGAPVITQAKVVGIQGFEDGDRPAEVTFRDLLRKKDVTVRAKGVVNCTGVWTDTVRRLAEIEGCDVLRMSSRRCCGS